MPSTNARPSSIRPSRSTQNRVNAQIVRSTSAPQQQFIMILTSNPILLQNTRAFQPPVISTWLLLRDFYFNYDYHFTINVREGLLNYLLRIELREAARDYLSRTRREYPLHYVFDMSDIEIPPPPPSSSSQPHP
ncbi:unnamed protein product [Rotaria magnacalcarata]|uniref:Uncharacterized protein n=1 Tax=Rotaria magnacalcarata TaxID=392030 RepID=A0A816TSW8_9BILA|nr:unnamed protein product [Rotaria magnacalcarata]CAF2100988.1 unnamed protein product [Rotaria magnacalcarata]CAF2101922.1 unnamed protein product [Rotaria magnacalcarata]CAF4355488.1 unnamed protein product [Rotaria magnacalcarata]CAF4848036.1 unnamed protein product [Rotaria magnacalcarata]